MTAGARTAGVDPFVLAPVAALMADPNHAGPRAMLAEQLRDEYGVEPEHDPAVWNQVARALTEGGES